MDMPIYINSIKQKSRSSMRLSWGKLLLTITILLCLSCDQYLDEVPDNRVALDNLDKAQQLLTNAYSSSSYAFTDWMTDLVGFTQGVTIRPNHDEAFKWQDFTAGPTEQDTPIFFWFETYTAIAHANEVLEILETLPADTEIEKAQKSAAESEALLTRAYGHFMLVNLFAKHYDETTAGGDIGVPYVETPETVFLAKYKRNTVQEVYDKVEADMLRGLELVDETFFSNSGKYHFNRNAALAFASRFYLYKGEYDKCLDFSNQLLGASPDPLIRDFTSQEFLDASSSIQGYPQLYSSPNQSSNLMLMRKISLVQRPDFAHGPTDELYSGLYQANPFLGTTDERQNPAFVKGINGTFPVRYESLFERSSLNSNVGLPYHIALAFRGEEVLLNRAEANIFLNNVDQTISDLQVLVDRRYSGSAATITIPLLRAFYGVTNAPQISDRVVLLEFLLLEKQKEFITQGLRWFDLKRYEIPVEHILGEGTRLRLEGDDLRKVLQIPTSAIDVGGLQPNPR